jgi:hypothetical protein
MDSPKGSSQNGGPPAAAVSKAWWPLGNPNVTGFADPDKAITAA